MPKKAQVDSSWILLGRIGAAHGIRGEVRLTAFTADPMAIAGYGPLFTDRPDLTITLSTLRPSGNVLVARIKGIADRTAAEKLNGVSLYIERDRLDDPEDDEFYHTDLIGLEVRDQNGKRLGEVITLANFGADDLLEMRRADTGKLVYLPFTKAVVPDIHIAQGYLTAVPPEGWFDNTQRDPEDVDPNETGTTSK